MSDALLETDLKHVWHPCSQMKDYEHCPPLLIQGAQGPYLELKGGKKIIDAISSWWCKPLGHGHPRLKQALLAQLDCYEHVIAAHTCQAPSALLAAQLAQLCAPLDKVFFASEGSSAVEIALKMSLHAHLIEGNTQRTQFMALENAYHGETALALSVSDLGLYRKPYEKILTPVHFLKNLPYVKREGEPLWQDCGAYWPDIERQLDAVSDTLSAIIVEPIVQGAGGMLIYSQDFLKRLRAWTKRKSIHLIADEIMTGLGRTGRLLACEYANIVPDFMCLGKNITGGFLPLSAVVTRNEIYQLFYDDYHRDRNFLHSHTFSGNALACSVALEAVSILSEEGMRQQCHQRAQQMAILMEEVAEETNQLMNVRHIGMIAAADLILTPPQQQTRAGYAVYQQALKLGALLRPLGNTLYWLPPFICEEATLAELKEITVKAIKMFALSG
ncbi:MAG: adenosylmethionine--8-amino-7-oxononanoate transaminase [Gammaproteobacteria bacterium]|nr:adenosylmethionine--8-amino-7-oxononanoate transaminase [Gammaproteobacteria bacterium]